MHLGQSLPEIQAVFRGLSRAELPRSFLPPEQLRAQLVSQGVFLEESAGLVLAQDYEFSSPSQAASVEVEE